MPPQAPRFSRLSSKANIFIAPLVLEKRKRPLQVDHVQCWPNSKRLCLRTISGRIHWGTSIRCLFAHGGLFPRFQKVFPRKFGDIGCMVCMWFLSGFSTNHPFLEAPYIERNLQKLSSCRPIPKSQNPHSRPWILFITWVSGEVTLLVAWVTHL